MLNFGNEDTEFPVPNSATRVRGVPEMKRKKKIDKLIVAIPLPKQGEKIFCKNCGNGIAENGGEKCGSKIWESKKKKCYVHNIFTINHM